jgi:hypothetical protein
MGACFFWDSRVRVQVVLDRALADEDRSCWRDEDGDDVGASPDAEQGAVVAFDWHLAGDVVGPELGQSLPDAA